MMTFDIYIGGRDVVRVSGIEATAKAWKQAKDFANTVDLNAILVDIETGEIVEDNWELSKNQLLF